MQHNGACLAFAECSDQLPHANFVIRYQIMRKNASRVTYKARRGQQGPRQPPLKHELRKVIAASRYLMSIPARITSHLERYVKALCCHAGCCPHDRHDCPGCHCAREVEYTMDGCACWLSALTGSLYSDIYLLELKTAEDPWHVRAFAPTLLDFSGTKKKDGALQNTTCSGTASL